jgi:ribonuclease H-related protein
LFINVCPALPTDYPDNIKRLIKQSIINLKYSIESEEYSQYTFSALRALEGHMKYIFKKSGVIITKNFDIFELNGISPGYKLKAFCGIPNVDTKNKLEKYYNYYHANRHTIFHFGDIIGTTDSTRMIETKREADEIIKKCIEYICE